VKLDWLVRRLLGVTLGGLFVYAGLIKCLHPYEFAEAVLAYHLLPESLVGAAAAVLPWVEMAAGFTLIIGLKRRSALLLLAALLAGFLVVILITLGRGLKIDCGCGLFFQRQVGPGALLEDVGFLLWAAGLYYWELLQVKRMRMIPAAEALSSASNGAQDAP
jgi:putative oxidoreductase